MKQIFISVDVVLHGEEYKLGSKILSWLTDAKYAMFFSQKIGGWLEKIGHVQ